MIVWLLVAVGVGLLLWPSPQPSVSFSDAAKPKSSGPDYMEAVECLQVVSKRLTKTQSLNEEERKALDVILLALSAGSAE